MLTFIPIEQIEEIENWDPSRINEKKELLAIELTSLVHGAEEAEKAKEASHALFAGGGDDSNMPTTELEVPEEGMNVIDLMLACSLAASKGEARRLIQQGGVSLDGEKVTDFGMVIEKNRFAEGVKIKKGKKIFHKAVGK
ncbi:MAG: tyrosine--tRNA ligase, partial [Clostridia bacterium]|nr:tyrosine--tRNA ligase [Clostridia bacterium]